MEDDSLEEFLNGSNRKHQKLDDEKQLAALPTTFEECDAIYKANYGHPKDDTLPLYLGVNKKDGTFYFAFGPTDPYIMNKNEFIYLMRAIFDLGEAALGDHYGMNAKDIAKHPTSISIGKGNLSTKIKAEDIKAEDYINAEEIINALKDKDPDDLDMDAINASSEKLIETLEDIGNIAEDIKNMDENLTEAEKLELAEKMIQAKEEELAKRTREFERSLLGTIEEEGPVTYNYDYFKKIHEDDGPEALREELAKLPKEERQEIIEKIMKEYQLKNKSND